MFFCDNMINAHAVKSNGLKQRKMIIARLLILGLLLTATGACNVHTSQLFDGSMQPTTYERVKQAIDDLYAHQPDIHAYVVEEVSYTPGTRDKVLKVCREGSIATTVNERERQRVLACAPLIFFFYRYGKEKSVPEAIEAARRVYWYAMTNNSRDSGEMLVQLLRRWQIE